MSHLYAVPGMSCDHCVVAITEEVGKVVGVESVVVDLDAKRVQVRGTGIDPNALVGAIDEAGYDAVVA